MSGAVQVLICCVCSLVFSNSARIFVAITIPSISHQIVFRPLTQELARRGHEVVVVTTDPVFPKGQAPANLTEIDVHDISYKDWPKIVELSTGKKENLLTQLQTALEMFAYLFDMQTQDSDFKKYIEEKQHFDLLIIQSWFKPAFVLSHIFKAPVIIMSTMGTTSGIYEAMGAATHPVLYPSPIQQKIYNLSLWDKVNNLYREWKFINMFNEMDIFYDSRLEKTYGKSIPSVTELCSNTAMLFLNIHPILEGNNPVPPAVLHTCGIHHKLEKTLPTDLKTYIDNSEGVIYMSFGTNTKPENLPPDRIQMFIRVFSKLPYNILWKWNQDVLPGKTENIKISKWFPQADLLRHPKVKLFISQGGLQSTDEAIAAGVPLIGIPMLSDQWYNTEKYVHFGIGMKLNIETITEEEFRKAIDEVIGNERYRRNIRQLDAVMRDEPMPPLQRAVWWVEHVLWHGGARHLRAPAANISWADYFELELFCTLLGAILLFLAICVYIFYTCISYVKIRIIIRR